MSNEIEMTQPEHMRHELLIRVDEQLKAVARDVQEVKNGYGAHLALLDANKMDKTEFIEILKEIDTLKKDSEGLKMWRWYTAGGLAVLTAVFFWIFPKFSSIEDTVAKAVAEGVSQSLKEFEQPI